MRGTRMVKGEKEKEEREEEQDEKEETKGRGGWNRRIEEEKKMITHKQEGVSIMTSICRMRSHDQPHD